MMFNTCSGDTGRKEGIAVWSFQVTIANLTHRGNSAYVNFTVGLSQGNLILRVSSLGFYSFCTYIPYYRNITTHTHTYMHTTLLKTQPGLFFFFISLSLCDSTNSKLYLMEIGFQSTHCPLKKQQQISNQQQSRLVSIELDSGRGLLQLYLAVSSR